jgi:hypothetical protein
MFSLHENKNYAQMIRVNKKRKTQETNYKIQACSFDAFSLDVCKTRRVKRFRVVELLNEPEAFGTRLVRRVRTLFNNDGHNEKC